MLHQTVILPNNQIHHNYSKRDRYSRSCRWRYDTLTMISTATSRF